MKTSSSVNQVQFLRSIEAWNDGQPAVIPARVPKTLFKSRRQWLPWLFGSIICIAILLFAKVALAQSSTIPKTESSYCNHDSDCRALQESHTSNAYVYVNEELRKVYMVNHPKERIIGSISLPRFLFDKWNRLYVISAAMFIGIIIIASRMQHNLIDAIYRASVLLLPITRPACVDNPISDSNVNSSIDTDYVQRPPLNMQIPSAEELVHSLALYAEYSPAIQAIPMIATEPWSLGLTTLQGNVRSENQDYGVCCHIGGYKVIAIADGMGGLPHGQVAAFLACAEALTSIVADLGGVRLQRTIKPMRAIKRAFTQAHHALSVHGDKLMIADINDGLRTTLIIVVAKGRKLYYGYIGDGAINILHHDGALQSILGPQRKDGYLNVLSASLGPIRQGSPIFGQVRQAPSDLVLVMTDGIADRVDHRLFARNVMKAAICSDGNLQDVTCQVVSQLAGIKDKAVWLFDDNVTLGLMGLGRSPVLGQDFWKKDSVNLARHNNHKVHKSKQVTIAGAEKEDSSGALD